jgi:enoyl-CoA hydratase/carnithine racemase
MTHFDVYRDRFPNAHLTRSKTGVLEVALHTDGGVLVFNGYTHEQFVDLFHAIGSHSDNRVVILTGSGDAFMETIAPDGFDFSTPRGYNKIYRKGKKVLMNILDIEAPMIAAVNGPVRLHSEYILLADIVIATPSVSSRTSLISNSGSFQATESIFSGRRRSAQSRSRLDPQPAGA